MSRARWWFVVLAVVAGLTLSLFHFAASSYRAGSSGFVDFPIFLQRTLEFQQTGVLYPEAERADAYSPAAPVYKFPPLFAMILLPVVKNGIPEQVYLYHWLLQLLLYAATIVLALRVVDGFRRPALWIATLVVALNLEPFFETLWRLQLETPILLLLMASVYLLQRGRQGIAGALVGICIMLKLYPAALLAYFVVRRKWAALGWSLATVALLFVSSLIVIGPEQNASYYTEVLPTLLKETPSTSVENVALGRHLQTTLGASPAAAKEIQRWLTISGLLFCGWLILRRREEPADVPLEFSLFVCLMLFAMPNCWVNYQQLLLLPLLVLASRAAASRPASSVLIALLGVSLLALLFYAPCAGPEKAWPCARTPWFLGLFHWPRAFHDAVVDLRILPNLLLWGATIWLVARGKGSATDSRPVLDES